MAYDYDLFTIGAGSGGVRASRLAAQSGAKVGVAEEYRPGGTCVIRGCVPKKFMVYASEFGHAIDHARKYGWQVETKGYDHNAFLNAMHNEIDRLSGIYRNILGGAGAELIDERAEIIGPHRLRLVQSGREVTAEKILIAVGGTPLIPDNIPGHELAISSNEAFHIRDFPEEIILVGGGYIAVEFAGIFNGLGVKTHLVYRGDKILRGFDEDIRTHAQNQLIQKGINLITNANIAKIEKTPQGGVQAKLDNGDSLSGGYIMFATGRKPHTQGLGCEMAGVVLKPNGAVIVDAYSKTRADHIWAVGDVTDRVNLTPVAIREGQAFAETEFYGQPTQFDHTDIATAVFTQPAIGTVGLSEAEARAQFGAIDIYKTDFRPMKDMLTGDNERAFMKLVVRVEDQRVLGCHIIAVEAAEIIQAVGITVKMGASKQDFDRTCALHPSTAEELVTLRQKS